MPVEQQSEIILVKMIKKKKEKLLTPHTLSGNEQILSRKGYFSLYIGYQQEHSRAAVGFTSSQIAQL